MVLPQDDPALRLITEANAAMKYSPVYAVKQSADGNDTAAAQAALDKARDAGGGVVFLPNTGVDWRLGKLTIYRNTTFWCADGVVIKRKTTTFGFTNYAAGINPLADNTDPYSGHGNIRIIGGTWDGNIAGEAYATLGFSMFYFASARGIRIEGVTVKDGITAHAVDINGCADMEIRNSRFIGYKDATVPGDLGYPRTYTEAIQYSQNLDETVTGSTYALGTPSTNVTIDNCVFGASGTAGTAAWPAAFGNHTSSNDTLSNNISITRNTFNGMTFAALPLYTYNDVRVVNNRFNSCAYGIKASNLSTGTSWDKATSTWLTGLGTRMTTTGLHVAHNRFVDSLNTDISILGTNADGGGFWATMNEIRIADNIMKATTTTKRTGSNIRLLLCKNATVHDNYTERAQININIDSCVNTNVHDNHTFDSVTYGIQFSKSATPPGTDATYPADNQILGNRVVNAGSHGIGNSANFNSVVSNNLVIDWGRVSPTANGILTSGTNGSLVGGNTIRTTFTGLGPAMAVSTAATTNINTLLTNRISKPDSPLIAMGTGTGNTYGNLTYT